MKGSAMTPAERALSEEVADKLYFGLSHSALTTYKGKLDGKEGKDILLLGVIVNEQPLDVSPIGIVLDGEWLKRVYVETSNGEWRHAF